MTFDSDWRLIEGEQEVFPPNLRWPVFTATGQVGCGEKVGEVESVTRGGAATADETTITRDGMRRKVGFGPDDARRAAV
jgi:hypothetical protein